MYHNFLIHLSADGHLRCLHILAVVNSASVNTEVHVSLSVMVSSGCMLSSGIVGSHGNFRASLIAQLVESACNGGELGSIPGLGRSRGGGHGNPLHILAWRISTDKGAWWATVHGITKSWTQLSD